jgi:beta-glucosidase
MAQATFHFPRGFLWGAATASHQVEGKNTNNNWWAWEQQAGHILEGHKSGLACDWWGGRWREDLDRAAEGGQNAHRMSIEWSRVQPAPNRWDEDALDRYRQMMRGLQERGMTPMVTLHHFSDPLWLQEQGGWEDPQVVKYFEAYTRKVVEALREYASLWVTINEPNVLASSGYFAGIWPPGRSGVKPFMAMSANQVRAHAAAYHAIHSLQPTARVGIAHHYRPLVPARSWSPLDRGIASLLSGLFNELIPVAIQWGVLRFPLWRQRIPEAKNTQDFLGLNYYSRDLVSFDPFHLQELLSSHSYPEGADLSPSGFLENYPQGMFDAIRWGLKFKLPIIITENGVEDAEDHMRPRYLIQHLHQVWRAVNYNHPVKGYFYWSLVDNFEWERGWTQRFGLWELDVETQARRKRPSASLYAEICQENGISSEMVARYAPEIFEKMFPN